MLVTTTNNVITGIKCTLISWQQLGLWYLLVKNIKDKLKLIKS
jgi:hypothetical protein